MAYYSGAFLLTLARWEGIAFPRELHTAASLFDLLSRDVALPPVEPPEDAQVRFWEERLREQREKREAVLKGFLAHHREKTAGCFTLCGYDPMNMWRQDDRLYCSTFLALKDDSGQTLCLPGEHLLEMVPGSPRQATAYL